MIYFFVVSEMSEDASDSEAYSLRLSKPKVTTVVAGLQECADVEALLQHAISCARRQNYDDASEALDAVQELMGTKNKK